VDGTTDVWTVGHGQVVIRSVQHFDEDGPDTVLVLGATNARRFKARTILSCTG